jgi:sulfatase modifying factor 1
MNTDSARKITNRPSPMGIGGFTLPAVVVVATVFVSRIAFAASTADMILIDDTYCIDRYEASLDAQSSAISVPGVMPTVQITQTEASAACESAGKRMCTDAEWLRACKGPGNLTYPYGNTLQPGRCNDEGQQISTTGSYSGCVTSEGAYDMVGNVNEWTQDPNGTFRGGYYGDIALNGQGCSYVTTAHAVSSALPTTGFRCCADSCAVSVATLSCWGFESPMNQLVTVKHKNRVLPLKMQLTDAAGTLITSAGVQTP